VNAGHHHTSWDCKDNNGLTLLSNYYDYHLVINDEHLVNELFLPMYYDGVTGSAVQTFQALAQTDPSGNYSIDLTELPFSYDNEIMFWDENGDNPELYSVSRTVKVWALHPQFNPVFLDSIYISESGTVISDLVME